MLDASHWILLITLGTALAALGWAIRALLDLRRGAPEELQRALAQTGAELRQAINDSAAGLQMHVQERVQQALHSDRIEQHSVLQGAVAALENRFNALQDQVERKLTQNAEASRLDLARLGDRLAHLNEATARIVELSKGVGELHALMKAPAVRGNFGEWTLERLLEDVLGAEGHLFRRQHTLSSGERADAAVFIAPKAPTVVCIDAKFPATHAQRLLSAELAPEQRQAVERQFARDVTTQARAVAEKYIIPPETLDFAFMFIPTEAIFQLLLRQGDLHERLMRMNVIPTSPCSFYAYLHAVAFARRGLRIQESALLIQKEVGRMAQDFGAFTRSYGVLGTHLRNAYGKYDEALGELDRFQQRLARLALQRDPEEPPLAAPAEEPLLGLAAGPAAPLLERGGSISDR